MLDTLPERVLLARQQKMPHQDFLLLVLSDEATRRDSLAVALRVQRARLDPAMQLGRVGCHRQGHLRSRAAQRAHDAALSRRPCARRHRRSRRRRQNVLAHALGHIACRRGRSVLAVRTDHMLKTLKHARLDHSYEAEFRKLLAVDLLILDDFALDALDPTESRDLYEILLERHRAGSIIVTSNRGPDEWLVTFADPIRAQSAIDRFTSNAYDLVIDGESYRSRLKPTLAKERRPA